MDGVSEGGMERWREGGKGGDDNVISFKPSLVVLSELIREKSKSVKSFQLFGR